MSIRIDRAPHLVLYIILCAALVAAPALASSAFWQWQNPSPTGNFVGDLEYVDSNTVVAVGDGGQVLRSTDKGQTWSMVHSNVDAGLAGVSFCDALHGVAVGKGTVAFDDGVSLVTSDGGQTWSAGTTGSTASINAVDCLTPSRAVLIGLAGTLRVSTDGGYTFAARVSGTTSHLMAMDFPDPLIGYVVGHNGTILKSIDGGDTWMPQISGSTGYLQGVDFVDVDTGWVVGVNGELLATTDGGDTWNPLASGTTQSLAGISMTVGGQGFICGSYGDLILHTVNGGQSWTEQPTGQTEERLWGVATLDGVHGVVAGGGGLIYYTEDAGTAWTLTGSGVRSDLNDLASVGEDRSVAVGDGGVVLQTVDAGATWSQLPVATTYDLLAVDFGSGQMGLACGDHGTILRSENLGDSWTVLYIGSAHTLYDIHMYGASLAVVVGQQGHIMTSSDGGANWTVRDSGTNEHLYGVWMINATDVVAVGGGGVLLRSTDSGATWTQVPSGAYQRLLKVHFLNDNVGIALGTYTPILLRTEDGGLTWEAYDGSLGGGGGMINLDFRDDEVGLIVGVGEMLSTFDGGLSWIPEPAISGTGFTGVQITASGRATAVGDNGNIVTSDLDPQIVMTATAYPGYNQWVGMGSPAIYLNFDQVTSGGEVTITVKPDGPDLGQGFSPTISPLYYDIQCTAEFVGEVVLVMPYDEADLRGPESEVRLVHYDAGANPPDWVDITTSVDELSNVVYGTTTFFSPFMVAEGSGPSPVPEDIAAHPGRLVSVAPSPFNPRTTIVFELGRPGLATVAIYDVSGRRVSRLAHSDFTAGHHELVWNGRDDAGRAANSGVYLVRLEANGIVSSRKILLVR